MSPYRKQQLKYVIADILSAELVWLAFLLFRWLVYEGKVLGMHTVLIPAFGFWTPLVVYPLACVVIYYLSGYYLRPFRKRFGQELVTTLTSALVIAFGAFFVIIIDDKVTDYHHYLVSLAVLFGLQFVVSYLPRRVITMVSSRLHRENDSVVIDPAELPSERALYERIDKEYPTGKDIYVVPRLYDIVTGAAQIGELGGSPYICITEHKMSDAGICIKRATDVVTALVVLLLLSPLYAAIAIAVRCSSSGPILYRQERIGFHGLPFMILKFRTMQEEAESSVPQLTEDDDPRITSVGRVLRRYRLDELPQMWNVLRGDMSLVGPRPERAYFIEQIKEQAPYYCLLYKIRPGLTSWGPIKVGYTDTVAKMVERLNYDMAYMENMSLALDMKILFYTIGVILDGKGK